MFVGFSGASRGEPRVTDTGTYAGGVETTRKTFKLLTGWSGLFYGIFMCERVRITSGRRVISAEFEIAVIV